MSDTKSEQLGIGPALAALQQEWYANYRELNHPDGIEMVAHLYQGCADALTPLIAQQREAEDQLGRMRELAKLSQDNEVRWMRKHSEAEAALAASEARMTQLEQQLAGPATVWVCACGWTNGVNLAVCAQCTRTPLEGQAVSGSQDITNLQAALAASEARIREREAPSIQAHQRAAIAQKRQCPTCKEWCAHGFCGRCEKFLEGAVPSGEASGPQDKR